MELKGHTTAMHPGRYPPAPRRAHPAAITTGDSCGKQNPATALTSHSPRAPRQPTGVAPPQRSPPRLHAKWARTKQFGNSHRRSSTVAIPEVIRREQSPDAFNLSPIGIVFSGSILPSDGDYFHAHCFAESHVFIDVHVVTSRRFGKVRYMQNTCYLWACLD